MKRIVWLSFAILLLASACTSYTCPTYAENDSQDGEKQKVEDVA